MKKFSEIKEKKNIKTNDNIKNEITNILEKLYIKVDGNDLPDVDISIEGKEQITEKLKNLITDIRIQERKNTLNFIKVNSYKNFNMNWLNEQIEGLNKIKTGSNDFILNEKLSDVSLGDKYRIALIEYIANNLNGKDINGWEFNYDTDVNVFDFENKELGLCVKATPFWKDYGADKIGIEVHYLANQDGTPLDLEVVNFNIEWMLYEKYLEIMENFLSLRPDSWNFLKESKVWTEEMLDKYVEEMRIGAMEAAEGEELGDAEIFDIASDSMSIEPGLEDAIRKFKKVKDPVGWLANQI